MKPSLQLKLDQLALRLDELNAILSSEEATRDMDRYRAMTREHAEIEPVVARYRDYGGAHGRRNGVCAPPAPCRTRR